MLFPAQRKIRKERSDFAAVEFWCRGLAKFLFASSQKCDSPFWEVPMVGFFYKVEWGYETSISGTSRAPSPTWFVGTSTMCGYSRIERANSVRPYQKKFIADRRYHNSSFLTPHSTNAAFFIKNLLQFQRYCVILIRYV